jgi:hypothetical protein
MSADGKAGHHAGQYKPPPGPKCGVDRCSVSFWELVLSKANFKQISQANGTGKRNLRVGRLR